MNIWIVDHYSSEPCYGGISRQYDFANEMSKRGNKVLVIASSYSHFRHDYLFEEKCKCNDIATDAHYAYVKTSKYKKNSGILRLINMISFVPAVLSQRKYLADTYGKPDVVVGCSIHPFTWIAGYAIAKKYNSQFIVEVRDLWPANQIYDEMKPKYHPEVVVFGLLEKWAYKRADKIIYSMSRGDKYLCEMLGIPKEKVEWIAQPMDRKRFDENAKNYNLLADELRNFIGNSFLCVFTGYYMDYEGVNEMVEAAKIIHDKGYPIKFVFVGSGDERKNLEEFVKNNDLDNVFIGGRIGKECIPALLRRADVCLAHLAVRGNENSYQFDASKNKLNEYMYSGACIIYGTYVKKQFVQESGAGVNIEPFSAKAFADAIEKFYLLPTEERKQYGINARKFVNENNSIEKLTDKYLALINR